MNVKDFLNTVSNQIKYKPVREIITEELKEHIDEIISENTTNGLSEELAEEIAVKQMGNPVQIGKNLNKIHKPKMDWITLILTLILILISGQFAILFHPDVSFNKGTLGLNDFMTAKLQYIIFAITILFSIFTYFYDYRKIYKHSKIIYILAAILNIIAFFRGCRENGNLILGLAPITWVSPTTFTNLMYIIAFAGFIKNLKTKTSTQKIMIIISSCFSVITALLINFVSGFLLVSTYLIIITVNLLKEKQTKNTLALWISSIILFSLLATVICIIPTLKMNNEDKLNKVITNDFDITNNYTSIRKKMERGNKMNKIFKYSLVPMAIVITLASVFLLNKRSNTNNVLDSDVKNNDVIIVNSIDNNSDNAKLDIDGRSEDITTDDLYKIYPLLKDIVVPNDYNINGIIKCYLFNDDTGKYDKLYGYNIIYSGGNNKYIDIFILIDTTKRLRCFSIDTGKMRNSIINGNNIKIMGEDKNYYAIFSYNNINFDIETTGISEGEFIQLIKSIVK